MAEIQTHLQINPRLCGTPVQVTEGFSRVTLQTLQEMAVDEKGLVHGGFVFGLADYAAMVAVNHPNVVLGAAETKFLKPIKAGLRITAEATVEEVKGRKHTVTVIIINEEGTPIFNGRFICFITDNHVLA